MSQFTFKQHARIADIPAAEWDACAGHDNPFVSHAFLQVLEESGSTGPETGWIPQHLSLHTRSGQIAAVAPAYLKLHSYGEYVFDQGWAQAFERAGGEYYPKLQLCVPFSPVPGPRILCCSDDAGVIDALANVLKKIIANLNLSSAHITFCTQSEWEQLGHAGWLQRLGMQYHWHNQGYVSFDAFLGSLTSGHRKSIRRERRDANAAGLVFMSLRGDDIKAHHWDAFYRFYRATADRKWGSAYLTRDFFASLSQKLGDRVVLMLASKDEVPVAGALNLVGRDTLYGRNWGCIGRWPFLHFELCYYRALDFAIEHGLARVEAGAQGEHKVQRGYLPQLTYSAHYMTHAGLADAVGAFLKAERTAIIQDVETTTDFSPYRQGTDFSKKLF